MGSAQTARGCDSGVRGLARGGGGSDFEGGGPRCRLRSGGHAASWRLLCPRGGLGIELWGWGLRLSGLEAGCAWIDGARIGRGWKLSECIGCCRLGCPRAG